MNLSLTISDMFGGGKIVTASTVDQNGDVDWYSYSYFNSHISEQPVVSYEVKVGKDLSIEHFENGKLIRQFGNVDDSFIRTTFAEKTGSFMNDYFIGKRQMQESEKISDVFKEFMQISDNIIKSSQRRQARLRAEDKKELEETSDEAIARIEELSGLKK